MVAGDAIVVSIGNNAYEREITVLYNYNKFYFKYFDLVSMDLHSMDKLALHIINLIWFLLQIVYQATETATSDSDANNAHMSPNWHSH